MIRKQINKADAILTADWHIWDTQPLCRTDDFWQTQINKIMQVNTLQIKHNCMVIHAGDLTEHWKTSPILISTLLNYLPKQFCTILGNHDLRNHSLETLPEIGINVLKRASKLELLNGVHWEQEIPNYEEYMVNIKGKKILVSHEMVWQNEKPWFDCTDPNIEKMFKKYPKADLILTGHNHKTCLAEKNGKIALNPGSLTRHKADQGLHKPCVWLYYANENKVIPYYLKIEKDVINREYIDDVNEKEDRIDDFLSKLNAEYKVKASYEKNVERLIQINDIQGKTKKKIRECL